jgi:organic hydroperoxide reductase OsmC/OhrA
MSEHYASVHWQRNPVGKGYSRDHVWRVAEGLELPASASPAVVPPPYSSGMRLDPEAAFVGSVSSCHMLWFLSIAEARGHVVASYVDKAVGVLGKDASGTMRITDVHLRPTTTFEGKPPEQDELDTIHDMAHARCFIANSVTAAIHVDATLGPAGV